MAQVMHPAYVQRPPGRVGSPVVAVSSASSAPRVVSTVRAAPSHAQVAQSPSSLRTLGPSVVSSTGAALRPQAPPAQSPSRGSQAPSDTLILKRLCHAVVADGFEEILRIRISKIQLPSNCSASIPELRCKAYVGPARALNECSDGHLDKGKFREVKLELNGNGEADEEVNVGVPSPKEPWAVRLKFYRRRVSGFFQQEKVAEASWVAPYPLTEVSLESESWRRPGRAQLEVVRVVPVGALRPLRENVGSVLETAVLAGVEAKDIENLCVGARELGREALQSEAAKRALIAAAGSGSGKVVAKLIDAGVLPSADAARTAEQAGHVQVAYLILVRMHKPGEKVSYLALAVEYRLPSLADYLLSKKPTSLDDLPPENGAAAKKAWAASAWAVLAAMLNRGDPMPTAARPLLDYALRAGHAGLARACLQRCEGIDDMQTAVSTCLDHGRVEIVREALEAQWRLNASQWGEGGPALLEVECGPADEPAECPVCFDPLWKDPGAMVTDKGFRACQHYICTECAEHIQDEAANRLRAWTARRDSRIPKPPPPACPLCRAFYANARRLPDPTVDPRSFFKLACVPNDQDAATASTDLCLTEKLALGTLCALLPLNSSSFSAQLSNQLWPAWFGGAEEAGVLKESEFLRPGGMLAWLSDHLLELKVEELRGPPPSLHDATAWFQHFDYGGKGTLTKPELLRGIAKAYDLSKLASPRTPVKRARKVGVTKLRDLVEAVWDDARWGHGVPLDDFASPGGLSERVLAALPGEMSPLAKQESSQKAEQAALTVEQALAKARKEDFEHREEDEIRAKKRAEARQRAAAAAATNVPNAGRNRQSGGGDNRVGAEMLLSSLLEAAASRGSRELPTIRIQCPFCNAVNEVRAAPRANVICGGCRGTFQVPAAQAAAATGNQSPVQY